MRGPSAARPTPGGGTRQVRLWRSERLLLSLFLGSLVAGMALLSLDAIQSVEPRHRPTARVAVGAAWALSALGGLAVQLVHRRRGTLILRDPRERAANRSRIRKSLPGWLAVGVGGALSLGAFGHTVKGVVFGLLGGFTLSFLPLLLWIAWMLRPEDREGERL